MQIHQLQAQQEQHQITTQTLLPYSGFIANTTFQATTIIPAPPRTSQPELINYSSTPQFSTQPMSFANIDKTSISGLPQPIHTVSNINDTLHDISLTSDTSISDPINSQFSSPTPSKIGGNQNISPQESVTNFERLLSKSHWNHSFNIVISSPSIQSSILLAFKVHTYNYTYLKLTYTRSRPTISPLYWETSRNYPNLSNLTIEN